MVTKGYKGLQWVTGGGTRLQGVTKSHKRLQMDYRGLQGVT